LQQAIKNGEAVAGHLRPATPTGKSEVLQLAGVFVMRTLEHCSIALLSLSIAARLQTFAA
jgi:hypothetical protein